ncbi:hypothetical protein HOLleu_10230 [Holothuria leucospilota]|uniref:Uncharacterized protein n=1 Tax=Holothuria leucospilota TaxID=206669 RepID=A0A9Q1CCS6_HOLLE|nr:hypothetical protein HOLleu_10230 [Holothuria leucospilota]
MPFNLHEFVASPSIEELTSLKRSEIVKVAKHDTEFQPLMRKDAIKRYVLEYRVDESILPSTVLETVITVPTDNAFELKRLEMEVNKVRLKELEREKEEKCKCRGKKETDNAFELKRLEMEVNKVRLKELEREKEEREMQMQREKVARERGFNPKIGLDTGGFDVYKHVKFVPKFQEDNVEKFFNHFEKLGEQLKCPRDKWSILVQSNLTGKAQGVYSALSIEDSMDHDNLKRPYYRPMKWCPKPIAKNLENIVRRIHKHMFVYQSKRHFDRWCASKKEGLHF